MAYLAVVVFVLNSNLEFYNNIGQATCADPENFLGGGGGGGGGLHSFPLQNPYKGKSRVVRIPVSPSGSVHGRGYVVEQIKSNNKHGVVLLISTKIHIDTLDQLANLHSRLHFGTSFHSMWRGLTKHRQEHRVYRYSIEAPLPASALLMRFDLGVLCRNDDYLSIITN